MRKNNKNNLNNGFFLIINVIVLFSILVALTSCKRVSEEVNPVSNITNMTNEAITQVDENLTEDGQKEESIDCFDSDNGTSYYVAGYVFDKDGNHSDICINYKMVIEQICKDNKAYNFTYTCPKSCSNGRCI